LFSIADEDVGAPEMQRHLRRPHNHPERPPSFVLKPDDTQITGEGFALPGPRLVELSATAQVIEKRVDLPALNQLHIDELRKQF